MTRRRYDMKKEEIYNLISITKDNLTIIRRKLKNMDINELDTEFKDIRRLFEEVDVYRQHIDYLDYIKNHSDKLCSGNHEEKEQI